MTVAYDFVLLAGLTLAILPDFELKERIAQLHTCALIRLLCICLDSAMILLFLAIHVLHLML